MKFTKSYLDKVEQVDDDRFKFVMSTDSVDRMGDVIQQNGWDLSNFKRSGAIALWNHSHDAPIGRWHNVGVKEGKLMGELEFVPADVDPFAGKLAKMVKAGFLKACSVGFRPIDMRPLKSGGYEFLKNELLECSLVAVGANQDAIAFAKSFSSDNDLRRMFAAPVDAVKVRQALARHKSVLAKYVD